MIDRYFTKDMKRIWSDENRFKTWEIVEITVAEIMSYRGIVPKTSFFSNLFFLFGFQRFFFFPNVSIYV